MDLTLVPEGWEINTEDTGQEIKNGIRAKSVRKELWKLATEALKEERGIWKGHDVSRGSTHKNIEILVVSHGAFLKKMCDQQSKCSNIMDELRLEDADLSLTRYAVELPVSNVRIRSYRGRDLETERHGGEHE